MKNKKRKFDIEFLGQYDENEVLLPPFFNFQVISNRPIKEKDKNICCITVEEIEEKHLPYKLIWLDKNSKFKTNAELAKNIRNLKFDLVEFVIMEEAISFIKNAKNDSFIVISSGSQGKSFLPQIEEEDNVIATGVYCWKTVDHKSWANQENLKKLIFLTSNSKEILNFLSLLSHY